MPTQLKPGDLIDPVYPVLEVAHWQLDSSAGAYGAHQTPSIRVTALHLLAAPNKPPLSRRKRRPPIPVSPFPENWGGRKSAVLLFLIMVDTHLPGFRVESF
jgi:hypothetical protein